MRIIWFVTFLVISEGFASVDQIKVWQRQPGRYDENRSPGRLGEKLVKLDSLQNRRLRLYDPQYEQRYLYQGVWLNDLLKSVNQPASTDTMLLHFKNEMIVPVPIKQIMVKSRLKIFIARKIKQKKWSRKFPPKQKPTMNFMSDPRPIEFGGQKIVVNTRWHPNLDDRAIKSFSPWLSVNTLVGIEFVNRNSYRAQFDFGVKYEKGWKTFLSRCQYCHGVNMVGASFGWDFVDPLPIYKKRRAKDLFYHVKYEKADAMGRGLMMPHQRGFAKDEATSLWNWLRAAAKHKGGIYYQP